MSILNKIKSSNFLKDELSWPFDFDVCQGNETYSWVKLTIEASYEVIAADGTGGVFISYGNSKDVEGRSILYASSEGQSGKIGSNLSEAIGIIVALPYWMDVLKFSGGGNLEIMKMKTPKFEAELREDHPDIDQSRIRIARDLNMTFPKDPVTLLHNNLKSSDCMLVAKDGSFYDSLFNTF